MLGVCLLFIWGAYWLHPLCLNLLCHKGWQPACIWFHNCKGWEGIVCLLKLAHHSAGLLRSPNASGAVALALQLQLALFKFEDWTDWLSTARSTVQNTCLRVAFHSVALRMAWSLGSAAPPAAQFLP